jgi:uncharacterized membrane protein YkoI
MQKLFSWLSIAAFPLMACSQNIPTNQVPSVVQNAVAKRFNTTNDIEWEKKSNNYEAEFKIEKIDHTVQVAPAGTILWVKKEITTDRLPALIAQGVHRDHPSLTIDEADLLEKDGTVYYQVELEKKGAKDMHIVYSADGTIANNITYID